MPHLALLAFVWLAAILCLALPASSAPTSGPATSPIPLPSPAEFGFHHCALIYDKPQRGVPELAPFVWRVRVTAERRPEWLFDAYLFLIFASPRGIGTSEGPTTRVDWQYQLDRWFSPNRDLAALDEAIDQAAKSLGPPPSKRQIILTIPYVNPSVRDFGDVTGDNRSEDLSTPAGRHAVLQWYIHEAQRRFAAAHYRHLELWGFYWMNESVSASDEPTVRDAAALVHQQSLRFFWIPFYQATGWQRWRGNGFDLALMQPNYAFFANHKGRVRRNRLAINTALAREYGLGVEMEAGALLSNAADRRAFLQYLVDGAPDRLGYQASALAYYLGDDTVERLVASPDPEINHLYDCLADFVAGHVVPEPDPLVTWTATSASDSAITSDYLAAPRACTTVESRFPSPRDIGVLEVFLDDPQPAKPWHGIIWAEFQSPDSPAFSPAGWTVRTSPDTDAPRFHALSLPIHRNVTALRVSFTPFDGSDRATVRAIAPAPAPALPQRPHLALDKPYQFLPPPPARYPDDGRKLIDGIIPPEGFAAGKSVGWIYSGTVTLCFDLQQVAPSITSIEVHCQGGGHASVYWPALAAAVLSADAPAPVATCACGPAPSSARWLTSAPLTIDHRRSADDMDAHLTFRCPPTRARYVNIILEPNLWLMLSEVRIFSDGANIAPKSTYTLRPPPSPYEDPAARYADDGRRLTDGVIAADFNPVQLTGWEDSKPRDVIIDLATPGPIQSITTWSLAGGRAGIHAPASVQADISLDGQTWQPLSPPATKPTTPEDGSSAGALPYRCAAPTPTTARLLRLHVTPDKGWCMLSEIEVH